MAHASHMILFPPKINGCIDGVGSGMQKKSIMSYAVQNLVQWPVIKLGNSSVANNGIYSKN